MLWSASCGMYHAVWMQLFSKTILKMACFWLNTWYSNFCAIFKENTGNNMKCPKRHLKDDFVMWWHLHFILKCPKIKEFHFRFLFCLKIDQVLLSEMPHFLDLEIFELSHFSYWEKWSIGKNGAFQKFRT